MLYKPSLEFNSSKLTLGRHRLLLSGWDITELNNPIITFSEMKCGSISMCFVLSWCTGFLAILFAAWWWLNILILDGILGFNFQFPQQSLQPHSFTYPKGKSTILRLCTISWNYQLLFISSSNKNSPYIGEITISWPPDLFALLPRLHYYKFPLHGLHISE